jgi:hypothetical protein
MVKIENKMESEKWQWKKLNHLFLKILICTVRSMWDISVIKKLLKIWALLKKFSTYVLFNKMHTKYSKFDINNYIVFN